MPNRPIVAIHQPNFFPWLGYFDKLARADLFIILDNVQFPKTGGSWSNRVKLLINGQAAWVTAPIVRSYHGLRLISDMEINNTTPWRDKLLKTVQMNYARTPFFVSVLPFLAELINNPTDSLGEYNLATIRALSKVLQIDPSKFILGSTLNVTGSATELLIALVKAVGGSTYLCGGGTTGYQQDELFAQASLGLIYQNFQHPLYLQNAPNGFIPGLSILDALMYCGFAGTSSLLKIGKS